MTERSIMRAFLEKIGVATLKEAAAEIERLRARVTELEEQCRIADSCEANQSMLVERMADLVMERDHLKSEVERYDISRRELQKSFAALAAACNGRRDGVDALEHVRRMREDD
uniref:Uncharacterized protein n=1 Tax=viral metagenome TaxID=1070528 RepID=A0A6H1ZJI0_9ZZZZ